MVEELHLLLSTLLEFYPKVFFIPKNGGSNKQYEAIHEINGELKIVDEIRKIVSDISTDDTQKIDKIDLLLAEGGLL